jgi:hypothetical protein
MKKLQVKIEEIAPYAVSIFVDEHHVAWQPFEPGSLLPWASKDAAQAWADEWVARNYVQEEQQ